MTPDDAEHPNVCAGRPAASVIGIVDGDHERCHERLAGVQDASSEIIRRPGVEQRQDDARPDQQQDEPEGEDDESPDASGRIRAGATAGSPSPTSVGDDARS